MAAGAVRRKEHPREAEARLGWRGWAWRLGLSGAGGCAVFLAFPTFDQWYLAWFALVPMLWSARGLGGRRRFLLGLWAGSLTNTGGFYWIVGMLMDFGHMSAWLAVPVATLLWVYQGLVFALWLWLWGWLARRTRLGAWLLAPVAFIAVEFAVWFIFPWYYANSQSSVVPLIQICELGGVALLGFAMVAVNGLLFDALAAWVDARRLAWRRLAVAAAVPWALAGYGLVRMAQVDADAEAAPKLRIGLVEADVGIWEKEDPAKIRDNLVRHQRMSMELAARGAELIVWPETSYHPPQAVYRLAGQEAWVQSRLLAREVAQLPQSDLLPPVHATEDAAAGTPLRDTLVPQRGFRTPLLFGALTFRRNPARTGPPHPGVDLLNTAILVDDQGRVLGAYDKVYLLMFGEYIPLGGSFPKLHEWLPEAGSLTPGEQVRVLPFGPYRIGVMVCYEDILLAFSRKLARLRPHVLINVTNDAWFGKTSEPYLHLALAVFRSVESRVPLIRSTNTGVSCFVDPVGRIVAQTSLEEAETLLESVPMMQPGLTPYVRLGDWPAYLCFLAVPGLWWWGRRRSTRDGPEAA
jgi:apolipoprotein N-acyltransferase